MKATSLIFGLIIGALVMASFGLFIQSGSQNYDVAYDNSTLDLYTRLNDTYATAEDFKASQDKNTTSSVVDIIGDLLRQGVQSVKITYQSGKTAMEMTEQATEDIGLPSFYYTAIITIILIFIALGVIISALIKKDM